MVWVVTPCGPVMVANLFIKVIATYKNIQPGFTVEKNFRFHKLYLENLYKTFVCYRTSIVHSRDKVFLYLGKVIPI